MKYLNKSFSVPSAGVDQESWDKIFGKKDEVGKMAKCDLCGETRYTFKAGNQRWCNHCLKDKKIESNRIYD